MKNNKINDEINILIVDDRVENLLVLEGLLESIDCNIIKATSGNEALGLMLEHDIALVLLDVQMPEMDGFETAELMRGNDRTRHVPIIFVTAIYKEKRFIFKGYEIGAVDYLFKPIEPVILKSKVNVFLDLYRQKKLLKEQAQLLEEKLKEVLVLQEANGRLHSLSNLDGLTGIPNRRSFDEYMKRSWRDSIREQQPISIIMIDIDCFKAYNDHYGHIKGDECLIKVAKSLAASVKRPMDFVARYGGEEFVAILPKTDGKGATLVAEDLRKTIQQLAIEHKYSQVIPYITVSLGVATIIPKESYSIEAFIDSADKALYQAKLGGRNRVISSGIK
ncbi:phytochrome-like protein Cph [Clostridium aceticum]|uniref:Stage 0 sporulation protein A homolog n=1 Tax=Clostridium aceticum TaxID=84022 RepID=A0A0D8I882_9CLOT|nr:diguanylate cyclase [Clostridium aceticum]AKL97213.1 phytochrome-like protein Cph [Clostridium aceticum]KJF26247.1 diguanylate cyclase [Clostridium aceticum]